MTKHTVHAYMTTATPHSEIICQGIFRLKTSLCLETRMGLVLLELHSHLIEHVLQTDLMQEPVPVSAENITLEW